MGVNRKAIQAVDMGNRILGGPTSSRAKAMTHDNVTDIVERLNCLHVWPQFVADEHADVILPRQSKGLYDVGHVAHEAADTIATLRKQLENAREVERRCPNCHVKFSRVNDVDAHIEALKGQQHG